MDSHQIKNSWSPSDSFFTELCCEKHCDSEDQQNTQTHKTVFITIKLTGSSFSQPDITSLILWETDASQTRCFIVFFLLTVLKLQQQTTRWNSVTPETWGFLWFEHGWDDGDDGDGDDDDGDDDGDGDGDDDDDVKTTWRTKDELV